MDEVMFFLDAFFTAEVEAITASRLPDIENFNALLNIMNSYVVEELYNKFGMIPLQKPDEDRYYEKMAKALPPDKRFLFRIDKYKTTNERIIYLCFVSARVPEDWKAYSDCLFVEKAENSYKIISKFFFTDWEMLTGYDWNHNSGDDSFVVKKDGKYLLDRKSLGALIEINRILPPEDDEESMEAYNKDEV